MARTGGNMHGCRIFDIRSDKNYGILLRCPLNLWMQSEGQNAGEDGRKLRMVRTGDQVEVHSLLFLLFLLIFVLRCPQKQGRKKK